MKNKINKLSWVLPLIIVGAFALLSSCEDNGDLDGAPVINKVYQLDTIARHKDSTFNAAEPYTLLVISGQNIRGVIKAYFNDYETSFNTNYNTNTELIITVPPEAPTDETVSNQIRLVTPRGEATFNFKIIAKPTISFVDKYAFGTGRGDLTFKGKNFADMISVVAYRERDFLTERVTDSVVCEIISKAPEKLVVRIPDNTISRVTLHFKNSSGTTFGSDVFINANVAQVIFAEDFGAIKSPDGEGKWNGDSWGNGVAVNTDAAFAGQKSLSIALNAGGWSWFGVTSWWPRYHYSTEYKYVTFAIKGGADDFPLWITSDAAKSGFAEFPDENQIEVKAKIWNYYKIAIEDLDFMYEGSVSPRIGFRPKGPDKATLIYVDDFMLVK